VQGLAKLSYFGDLFTALFNIIMSKLELLTADEKANLLYSLAKKGEAKP